MVRRQGDDKRFPGGRAAERLKLFEMQRGLLPKEDRDLARPSDEVRDNADEE